MKIEPQTEETILTITGMTCAACSARIEKALGKMEGVEQVNVNLALHRAFVRYDCDQLTLDQIEEKIRQVGYGVAKQTVRSSQSQPFGTSSTARNRLIVSFILSIPLFWAMGAHLQILPEGPALLHSPWFQFAIATVIQFGIGLPFYIGAFHALRQKSANMDVLIALGTSAAYFYSHYLTFHSIRHPAEHPMYLYDASAMIITTVLFGKWLEAKAKKRTLRSLDHFYDANSGMTTVIRGGVVKKVAARDILVGDTAIIGPGERIAVDGRVIEGSSDVNEAMITGESLPKAKHPGDPVISGTLNLNGTFKMIVDKTGDETNLARMIRLMEDAQYSKAPIQRMADRISGIFVPVILVVAGLTFIAWNWLLAPGNTGLAIERMIAVMVVACPCALGLATPTSILVGTGRAAELGIWFKEGKQLEVLHGVDTILLDKTGTVTSGRPQITNIWTNLISESSLLSYAAAAERYSEHPLARAIVVKAQSEKLTLPASRGIESFPGYGVAAVVGEVRVIVGNRALLQRYGIRMNRFAEAWADKREREGKTVIHAVIGNQLAGMLAAADSVKPSAKQAVARFAGWNKDIILITGDNIHAAQSAAKELGIARVYYESFPEEKLELIRSLQSQGKKIAMVGDGMNDVPALAAADVGIALGTGADIALEAADMNLSKSDLNGVADAMEISKRTVRNIQQNLGFAFLYNAVMIPFAAAGWLPPWAAGLAMAMSSVTVVMNALRLQKIKVRST
ncbi:heavy metal translocating P-type ATPase [Ferviditalea candida]|uniref:P-type Cu(+) transporter n=1 Tax=Ferviditalea candida TaxID=3108399 RepID=A0ABU5ZIK8_9BACL|nr:heavy metal translocating P-type ATPase [Paenibacillaceae bacterium T2]